MLDSFVEKDGKLFLLAFRQAQYLVEYPTGREYWLPKLAAAECIR